MLEVTGLEVRFGRAHVLRGVSVQVQLGEVVGVIGPNGAGKSTLVNTVAGLNPASAGSILVDGVERSGAAPAAMVGAGLMLVPQGRRMFGSLTVQENLELGAYTCRSAALVAERIEAVLAAFPELLPKLRARAGTLSGGQQQLVAVARGVMSGARLLLMDEPSLGVAPAGVGRIREAIRHLCGDLHLGVLLIEQNLDLVMGVADRIVVLVQGRDVLACRPADLQADPDILPALYFGARAQSQGGTSA